MRKSNYRKGFEGTFFQVCLVYSTSEYYNSPARIIILMTVLIDVLTMKSFSWQFSLILDLWQEVCNLLIDQARKFLDPETIFQIEVQSSRHFFQYCFSIEAVFKGDNSICHFSDFKSQSLFKVNRFGKLISPNYDIWYTQETTATQRKCLCPCWL